MSQGAGLTKTTLTSPNAYSSGIFAYLSVDGNQRVTLEPHVTFYDSFDGSVLDVTNKWSTTGTAPTIATSNLTIAPGVTTTASAVSAVYSQSNFAAQGLNYAVFACVAKFEYPLVINTSRYMGVGIPAGSPTATAPMTDGVGFEIYTDGNLYAVIYSGGTRNVVANLSSKVQDSNFHRFAIVKRTDLHAFYIDSVEVPVAISQVTTPANYYAPQTQGTPVRIHQYNASSAPSANSFILAAVGMHDTGSNANQLADGTYAWRKATVSSTGGLSVIETGTPNAAVTSVTAATSDTTLLSANTSRKMATFFNDADVALYLKYGTGSSSTSYTVKILAGSYFETPNPSYTGQINGIWPGTAGGSYAVRVTEIT